MSGLLQRFFWVFFFFNSCDDVYQTAGQTTAFLEMLEHMFGYMYACSCELVTLCVCVGGGGGMRACVSVHECLT